tara:strand:- start:480 stop:797 length:318 start_codon:yes stop_codon:yes gene_type:complete
MCFKRLQPATTSRPRAVVALVGALLVSPSCDDPTPLDVDIQVMQRMLAEPDWTPDEWERWCDPMGGGASRCVLVVELSCPPDCGVYVSMRQNPLARVISRTAATQ